MGFTDVTYFRSSLVWQRNCLFTNVSGVKLRTAQLQGTFHDKRRDI